MLGEYVAYTRSRYGGATGKDIRRVRRVSAKTLGVAGQHYPHAPDCPWRNSTVCIDIDARDNASHPHAAKRDHFNNVFPPMDIYGAVVWPRDMTAALPPNATAADVAASATAAGPRARPPRATHPAALAPVGSTVYWAFPWRFWHFAKGAYPATYDVAAMASRDGLNFSYIDDRRPFISTGRDGTPGSRRIRVLPSPVVVGDTM
jgi:hypothetical protein